MLNIQGQRWSGPKWSRFIQFSPGSSWKESSMSRISKKYIYIKKIVLCWGPYRSSSVELELGSKILAITSILFDHWTKPGNTIHAMGQVHV